MDDEFIKRFFGTPIDPFGRFGNVHDGNHPPMDDRFIHHDINQMFRDMESMMRMFHPGQFTMIESPQQFNNPSIEEDDTDQKQSLRESFLKPKNQLNDQETKRHSSTEVYSNPHSFIEKFLEFPKYSKPVWNDNTSFEEDLDEKVKRDGFDTVLREDLLKNNNNREEVAPFQQNKFFGQSSSVRRVQRPDGTIEEIKTERSSDGVERKAITRIIGDKSHTLVEKKSNGQVQETEEFYNNFDHDKIDEFNKMWSGASAKPTTLRNNLLNDSSLTDQNKTEAPKNTSVVSKLFSWFK